VIRGAQWGDGTYRDGPLFAPDITTDGAANSTRPSPKIALLPCHLHAGITMITGMALSRNPPRWEREAPLTPEAAAKIYRTVQVVYGTGVAVFWAACAVAAVVEHRAAAVVTLVVLALLDAGAVWVAFRAARAGIRRNTVARPNGSDVGL
jgi:hypothetical protein